MVRKMGKMARVRVRVKVMATAPLTAMVRVRVAAMEAVTARVRAAMAWAKPLHLMSIPIL
jgi:hypothetical protein